METVAFCEIDPFCRKVLAKHWPGVPIYEDIKTISYADGTGPHAAAQDGVHPRETRPRPWDEQLERYRNRPSNGRTNIAPDIGPVDLICGGYPCQPFSLAGKRKGAGDDRHLWPELFRLVQDIRPTWVLCENVVGHINMGLDSVLADLESAGYQSQTFCIPACAVDAPHRRDRVWIVAHADSQPERRPAQQADPSGDRGQTRVGASVSSGRREFAKSAQTLANTSSRRRSKPEGGKSEQQGRAETQRGSEVVADADIHGRDKGRGCFASTGSDGPFRNNGRSTKPELGRVANGIPAGIHGHWPPEPDIPRVATGIPDRVNRLKALGNAVVPALVQVLGESIMAKKHE